MNIPRHPVSVSFLKILLTWVEAMGATGVPSLHEYLQAAKKFAGHGHGSQLKSFRGSEGNFFYATDVATAIGQDFASPLTQPHMRFYPQQNAGLQDLCDGQKLGSEIDACISPPMVRLSSGAHAYLHEAVQLTDSSWVYPSRWFLDDSVLSGEGCLLKRTLAGFLVEAATRTFPISQIKISALTDHTRAIPISESATLSCVSLI